MIKRILKASILALALFAQSAAHTAELLDKAAVIVDRGVILESEINSMIDKVKNNAKANNQTLPSDKALRTQVIDRLILQELQMQMAKRAGYKLTDTQLQTTIENIAASKKITVEQLRAEVLASGSSYEDFREEIKIEVMLNEVRRGMVSRRVYVSPQEIDSLVKLLREKGRENDEYHLGHILIGLPASPTPDEIEATKNRAAKVISLLEKGKDFKKVAIASSAGGKALDGGDLGWMNINEMPTLFAEAVENQTQDAVIGPIRSGAGFHILKIFAQRGLEKLEVEEVKSRHILVKPSIILSDAKAKEQLETFLVQIKSGEAEFAELAKQYSEDPGSAARGGDLGWSDPKAYVPEFRDALVQLQDNEFAGPLKTAHGWHILQLLERRTADKTDSMQKDQAYQMLFNRKFAEESEAWYRQIRDDAYIEILD